MTPVDLIGKQMTRIGRIKDGFFLNEQKKIRP